jgi:hypothetical protein
VIDKLHLDKFVRGERFVHGSYHGIRDTVLPDKYNGIEVVGQSPQIFFLKTGKLFVHGISSSQLGAPFVFQSGYTSQQILC